MRCQFRHPHHRKVTRAVRITIRHFLPLVAAVIVSAALPVFSQDSSRDEAGRVLALENAWNHAIEDKDTKALDQILADTFVAVDSDGSVSNKADFLAAIRAPEYQPSQAVYEQIHAQAYGETVVTIGIFRVTELRKGKPFTRRERFIDTWIKKGQTWQCVASQVVLIPAKQPSPA
jgi:ketosteroid isomerase-like protein